MDIANTFASKLQNFSFNGYCQNGAIENAAVGVFIIGTICFLLTKITKEYSWVDRIWSLLPIGFSAHYLYFQQNCEYKNISLRQWIMFGFVLVWGLRLTYNYYRKGGYAKGGEDYRWAYIRQNYHWILVELLNFFFIAYYQIYLILAFSTPIYFASNLTFKLTDVALCAIWIMLFCGEVIADEQQWEFQKKKYKLLKEHNNNIKQIPAPYNVGFIKSGLWRFSRHPNFFCQISMWYVMFAFSVSSQGWNYSLVGCVLLHLLFLGSTSLTEKISSEKYPVYKEYQRNVSMLFPMPSSQKKIRID